MNRKNPRNRGPSSGDEPKSTLQKLNRALDIPQSAMLGTARIELAGNREAVIDGCEGIIEYDENIIKLSTGKMSVCFLGRDLQIKVLTPDSAVIEGFIQNIEFIS